MGYHNGVYYNHKCKKGNVAKTGHAWWYDQTLEDPNNPSHYDGFIPLSVLREAFGWSAEESVSLVAKFVIDGQEYEVPITRFKALGRSDWIVNGIPDSEQAGADKILDVPNIDYGVHDPKEVFISNVATLFDGGDNIGCESFGELKWGRRLFASFSVPDHLLNDESGLAFRPILTVVTSYDRTLATKYVRTFGIPVCDNTVNYELARAGEKDGHFVLRHSKNSAGKLMEAKRVLGLLNESADEMNAWLDEQVKVDVSEADFVKWLDEMIPVPELTKSVVTVSIQGEQKQIEKVSTNRQTVALNKRDKLIEMWDRDPRVAPWKNTRLGIFQLWNTYQHHETSVKATSAMGGGKDATVEQKTLAKMNARIEKNMDKILNIAAKDSFMAQDMLAMDTIARIQAEGSTMIPVGAGK